MTSPNSRFAATLIRWQKRHGRHDLPWQGTRDPYRVWLSEIMLQQTQVSTVIPYYRRFLDRFPDVASLADAPAADVMALWSGLGYYARARNLHRCAQAVLTDHGGRFPADPVSLAGLPGIGRSTAAAIAVFAFGISAAILDGNVKRVFARFFGIDGYPGNKAVEQTMWGLAESLLPKKEVETYTQGLMDLGATICTRGKPDCPRCPLAADCVALAQGRIDELPARKPRAALREKTAVLLVIVGNGEVLLEQRPPRGIWGGLLSLPEIEATASSGVSTDSVVTTASRFGEVASCEALPPLRHDFTHFRLHIRPYAIHLGQRHERAAQDKLDWYPLNRLDQLGLPAPVRLLLQRLSLAGSGDPG